MDDRVHINSMYVALWSKAMHQYPWALFISLQLLFSSHLAASVPVAVGEGLQGVIGYSDGKLHGSLAPLYECVFDRADIQPQFIQVPLKRGLGYLHSGEVSMVLPLAQSERRDRIGEFAGELFSADYVFVSNRQLPPISETSGLKYGLPRSFVGEQFITDKNPRIEEVTDWMQLVAMLHYDRLDAIVLPALLVGDLLGPEEGNVFEQPAGTLPVSLYMSRDTLATADMNRIKGAIENCRNGDLVSELK